MDYKCSTVDCTGRAALRGGWCLTCKDKFFQGPEIKRPKTVKEIQDRIKEIKYQLRLDREAYNARRNS